jgi:capsular polysaccharide biosynthesis protein
MLPFKIATGPARTLCEETLSVRRLPENFDERDRILFGHELNRVIPATQLLELDHVNVNSDPIVFRAGRVLAESFGYRDQFIRWAKSRNLLKFFIRNYVFKSGQRLENKALWIIDNWSSAYFHWLVDALPRLYVIRHQLADSTLLLPKSYEASRYILPSLAPFTVGNIRFIGHNQVFHCRKLLVPSHTGPSGNYNESIVRHLRELYRNYYAGMQNVGSFDKIYISRSKARVRRIINETDLAAVLKERGFRIVVLEDYPFEQQVKIVLNARYLVSNHGAGLTNMLFLPAGSNVFELRKCEDSHNNCYFTLASALGLEYYYQLCKPENPDEDAYSANIYVDLKLFRKNLELMLARDSVKAAARAQRIRSAAPCAPATELS